MKEKTKAGPAPAKPPFSRVVEVDKMPAAGIDVELAAAPDERAALAAMDGLLGIAKLEASLHLAAAGGGRFEVRGRLEAQVTQVCVLSLETFECEIEAPIEVVYAAPDASETRGAHASASPKSGAGKAEKQPLDAEDPPDPIIDGKIDLGALAAEFLALNLDPYPRKPGVAFASAEAPQMDDVSPFAVLGALKKDS
jgi:hypothetical protein